MFIGGSAAGIGMVLADHPLRPIRMLVNEAPGRFNGLFNAIHADSGRDSIEPEKLLRAVLDALPDERQKTIAADKPTPRETSSRPAGSARDRRSACALAVETGRGRD